MTVRASESEIGLTGRYRFRVWKDNLVLQVETLRRHIDWCGGSIDEEQFIAWRDARVEDITIGEDEIRVYIPTFPFSSEAE